MNIKVGNFLVGKINTSVVLRVLSLRKNGVLVKMLDSSIESYAIGSEFLVKNEYLKAYQVVGFSEEDLNTEYVKGKTDGYNEGYQHGFTLAKEKITELDKEDSKRIYNDGYVKGHNEGWRGAVKAYGFGTVDKEYEKKLEEEQKKGFDNGYNEGYNTAIKEMSNSQALGETTEYKFGTEDCCEHQHLSKETQEVIQEVLDRDENSFAGVWVAKDGSGKLKVLNINKGICDVELVEHNKVSFFYIGANATISVDDLKEHWNKEHAECNYTTTEDDQLQKELSLVEKYPHYYKDIRHLNIIDIYRFFDLFEVTDPCIQHSVKKLAVGGKRGDKDYEKDIKEAMDTLKRWEYMQEENKRSLDD